MLQPKQFSDKYASIFQDASVVAAYPHRPPYPPETFALLAELLDQSTSLTRLLDAGCGLGQMTQGLLPHVDYVDAVDISSAMIVAGKRTDYGTDPRINWIVGGIDQVPLNSPYALIVAAASLHWMPWATTLPRFAQLLAPNGYLALVELSSRSSAWADELRPFFARYSMNRDFQPYSMQTVADELQQHGLFVQHGVKETKPVLFRQPIDAWIEAIHARNGFSRDRMDIGDAAKFDQDVRRIVDKYCPDGEVEEQLYARIIFGKPLVPSIVP